jgi:hypothetical protein
MADHGEVQYATAKGNDYPAHEATYSGFLHLTLVGIIYVVNILFALTIGGVMDRWLTAAAILMIATAVAAHGLWSGSRISSFIMLAIGFAAFAFSA